MAEASTATTVNATPADSTITGAATDTAIGRADSTLASDTPDCARAPVKTVIRPAARTVATR